MFHEKVTPTGMLVLLSLNNAPRCVLDIVETIKRDSKGVISIPLGTLYPLLYSLEGNGMVQVSQDRAVKRRYYEITDQGRMAIKSMLDLQTTLLSGEE